MACGCNKNRAQVNPAQNKQVTNLVSNNLKKCPKCSSTMVYKQQFVLKLRGYIKIWECSNKPCNYKIVGR